jgi:hypothetical protein
MNRIYAPQDFDFDVAMALAVASRAFPKAGLHQTTPPTNMVKNGLVLNGGKSIPWDPQAELGWLQATGKYPSLTSKVWAAFGAALVPPGVESTAVHDQLVDMLYDPEGEDWCLPKVTRLLQEGGVSLFAMLSITSALLDALLQHSDGINLQLANRRRDLCNLLIAVRPAVASIGNKLGRCDLLDLPGFNP